MATIKIDNKEYSLDTLYDKLKVELFCLVSHPVMTKSGKSSVHLPEFKAKMGLEVGARLA